MEKESAGLEIVGLGPGDPKWLTREAWDWLQICPTLMACEPNHPALEGRVLLPLAGQGESPRVQAEQICALVDQLGGLTLASAGNPLEDSVVCRRVAQQAGLKGISVRVIGGLSLSSAAAAAVQLGAEEITGRVESSQVLQYYHPPLNPCQGWFLTRLQDGEMALRLAERLLAVYPADHRLVVVHHAGWADQHVRECTLQQLGEEDHWDAFTTLYLPPVAQDGSFEAFQDLIAHLRAPNGCPWDREQTHLSLRSSLLEEAYETLDAIDSQAPAALREELGDLLLQIVLHAQIAFESGNFTMTEVLQDIQRKLVYRHPHVFGVSEVEGSETVLRNWEKLKEAERAANGKQKNNGLLDGVPKAMPALSQAQKYQERAARVGFDWDDIEGVTEKLAEELQEFKSAASPDERRKELGDVLFSIVNLARWMDIEAESALRETNAKFKRRFAHVEKRAKETGRKLTDMTLQEMDAFWDESKRLEE